MHAMTKSYWHFCALDDNGNPIMPDGIRGYHGSSRVLDALRHAPGPWVSLRPLENVIDGNDKSVGQAFVQQHGFDATPVLREFARWCALQVADSWVAPAVIRKYLETGNESLRIEPWDVVQAATWAAERDAGEGTAWAAARAAALGVAQDAAWVAAWDKQNTQLESMLMTALQDNTN